MNEGLLPALQRELFKQHSAAVHDEWIEDCLEQLAESSRNVHNLPLPQVLSMVVREFLATNLNDVGVGKLPTNLHTWHAKVLKVCSSCRNHQF
jgi:hypothetical protein